MQENITNIAGYKNGKLEILIIHHRKTKEDTFKGITKIQNPLFNEDKTCVEWQAFKHFMYLKCNAHHCQIDTEMQSYKEDEKEMKEETLKRQKNFGLHDLLKEMKIDDTVFCIP